MSVAHMLFVRDFEAEIDAEREHLAREANAPSAADLAQVAEEARAAGHAAGFEEGLASGRDAALAGIEAQRLDLMEGLAQVMADLAAERAAHRRQLELEMAGFVGQLVDRLVPELIQLLGARRVAAEIDRVVRRAIGSPSLDIRLAPDAAESMAGDLAALADRTRQTFRVLPDPALQSAEVCAAWQDGRSRYSFPAICRAVQTMIRRVAQSPSHVEPQDES
jgi:flagellar assembly protein FliH